MHQIRKYLAIVMTAVIMTAQMSIDVHICGALCRRSSTENPLSDLRFDVTFAAMRGNVDWSEACWYSDQCSMSNISHALSLMRIHLPPNRSIWQSLCMNVETCSDDIIE